MSKPQITYKPMPSMPGINSAGAWARVESDEVFTPIQQNIDSVVQELYGVSRRQPLHSENKKNNEELRLYYVVEGWPLNVKITAYKPQVVNVQGELFTNPEPELETNARLMFSAFEGKEIHKEASYRARDRIIGTMATYMRALDQLYTPKP